MMHALVNFAVQRRWMVLAAVLFLAAMGLYQGFKLPIDAVPDITNVQVQINTEAPGYSPLEAEQRISYIIENAMAGLPKLDYSRSLSRYGLSQVTVIFDEGTDIYWARQQITERLQTVRSKLPANIEPELGPIVSGLGEIFSYRIYAKSGAQKDDGSAYDLTDLRSIQDWIIRPQLVQVLGITEINSMGGYTKQYEVVPEPSKLLAYKISLADIVERLEQNNINMGAGFIVRNDEQWLIRSPGQLKSLSQIEQLVIAMRDSTPVRIKDIGKVRYGKELRSGAATANGQETLLGTAFMLLGENSRVVAKAVAAKLEDIKSSLPKGIKVEAVYDRTHLVDKTIATVKANLFEGAILVIVILFALLGNFRAAVITALVIPLSMLFAITGMTANRVSGNLMSLGAIDFGLIVDGAVIVVENTLRRLALAQKKEGRNLVLKERLSVVIVATKEVFKPAVFGILIIMLVYIPIFALNGIEGKMFHPMAFTVIAALLGALIFSVTFIPAAMAIFITGKVVEEENKLMLKIRKFYQPILKFSLMYPARVGAAALFLVLIFIMQMGRLGTEFMPKMDEHDIALHALRIPGTSLQQSIKMQKALETEIIKLPEVQRVFSKIGTPEIATDPMPPNVADTFLILKPRELWPNPNKEKAQFIKELRERLNQLPGNQYEYTQPIAMRFNELIAGVRADVAVRIYGDDLQLLNEYASKAQLLLAQVSGATDVGVEQGEGLPMIEVRPHLDRLALLGLNVADVQASINTAIAGTDAGLIYEGDKSFKLKVRLDEAERKDMHTLSRIPLRLPANNNLDLAYVPLGEVADLVEITSVNKINRQHGKRNRVVTTNVENRDLGSFIADVQKIMQDKLNLPAGYWLEYGGTFEQLQSAQQRLSWVVPITLLLIFVILFALFNSFKDSVVIFSGVPLALTGGVLALTLRDMPLSISALIGFIALSGIAVLNGVVLLTVIRSLRNQGVELIGAIYQGASQRLRPVLMTALVASLGFIPMALNTSIGAEIQRPLATVVVGGIISSTLLTLVVLPALLVLINKVKSN